MQRSSTAIVFTQWLNFLFMLPSPTAVSITWLWRSTFVLSTLGPSGLSELGWDTCALSIVDTETASSDEHTATA